ncbi:MAG: TIGR01212 family radical SAM protein [Candidatus Sumerlaeia bacterium]|nr:TIGR01212 family radical SAM protein [Candidatus Sumerlaeia bacterium]
MKSPPLRYCSFSSHLRQTFGCRVHRVAVDAGMTCPTRDGTLGRGGCIYCEEAGARAAYVEPALPIREQVRRGIEHVRRRYKAEKFLVYFQPYTNTYAPVERLRALFDEALDHPDVVGLMIGTRPDCLVDRGVGKATFGQPAPQQEPAPLALLEEYHRRTYLWVELGLQSVNDATLAWVRRGHDFAAFERAAAAAKARGLRLCAHVIVGLPTDRREDHLAAADALNRLGFDGVKIHCLYVSRNAPLGEVYAREPFPLMTREEYVERVCDILERLNPRMVIHRLTSDADRRTLVAPLWCLDKGGILSEIDAELARRGSRQGSLYRTEATTFAG